MDFQMIAEGLLGTWVVHFGDKRARLVVANMRTELGHELPIYYDATWQEGPLVQQDCTFEIWNEIHMEYADVRWDSEVSGELTYFSGQAFGWPSEANMIGTFGSVAATKGHWLA